ncbi:hypothetical protein ACROYT_G001763 [Oculina patagonica]
MVCNDRSAFTAVKRFVENRNHQNITSWAVYAAALAAHGKYEAQNILAHAVKTDYPRPLTDQEYEALLLSIYFLPDGPLHSSLFKALSDLSMENGKGEDVTATAMLVLAALTERAKRAGYNDTLSDTVAEMVHHRYRNRSSLYHPDSEEYESHLRDHVWAFGNLGHHSGLPVLLEHIDHDNSDIRSSVISAMRKLSPKHTDQHLMRTLHHDEHSEVKAAVVNVFIDRHQNLTESVVRGLEHALWHANKGDALDSSIQTFLENHGNHTKAVYLRTNRGVIRRRKRALIPELRPREFEIGKTRDWDMGVGGDWLGAEAAVNFMNKLQLRVGIFGGKFEINLDNNALIQAHILKFPFEIAKGKAAFKASASFKNDFPKDLIHTVADAGDELLRNFDSITSVITKKIEKFRAKLAGYVPLSIDKFTAFVRKMDNFLKDITFPLQALKGIRKVIGFSNDLGIRVKDWMSLIYRVNRIQQNLAKLTGLDTLYNKVLRTLDTILGIIDDVSKHLPNSLPDDFNIKTLLQTLREVPVSHQSAKIKEYFKTLGSSVPDGFYLQLPFMFSIHFSASLEKFQEVLLSLLQDIGGFFSQFTHLNFGLETFFQEILPGGSYDLQAHFPGVYKVNHRLSSNPSDSLQLFLSAITDIVNFHVSNISEISQITDFFQELGPAATQFAEQNAQKVCRIHETAFKVSDEIKDFGEKIEKEEIFFLEDIQNTTQKVLLELLNLTITLDTLIEKIERNFTNSVKGFISDSLQDSTDKLRNIQDLADGVVNFTSGTSSKFSGACTNAAAFSADIIDEVQNNARQAVNDLSSVIGPVEANIKAVGTDLKSAVTKVEKWYEENLAARVGKMSRVFQTTTDFLSIVNTKNNFLNDVRDLASRLNEVLKQLKNLPQYAIKAKKTVDEVIDFATGAQNYKDKIQKLDVRKQFGIDFDKRIKDVCNKFKSIATVMLGKVRNFDVVEELNTLFIKEANMFVDKALPKFRSIKHTVVEIRRELQEVSSMAGEVITIFRDLRPFTYSFSPILESARKLPDCQGMTKIFFHSTKPCVRKALLVGGFLIDQYKDFKKEIVILNKLVPETWKNFRIQKCVRGGSCISKAFIEQGKVIKNKVNIIKEKLEKASEYTDLLSKCEEGVNNMTGVVKSIKLLMEQVRNFSLQDNNKRVKAVLQKISGRTPDEEVQQMGSRSGKRSIPEAKYIDVERTADYIQKIKKMEKRIQTFLGNMFQALGSVYNDAILKQVRSVKNMRSNLELSYRLWLETKDVSGALKALDTDTKSAFEFANKLQDVTNLVSNPTGILLANAEELSDVVKPHLDKYTPDVTGAVSKVNGFLDKVTDFLNSVQTRQRGLNPSKYKRWQDIPYCSEEVCLRSIRRSSPQYLSDIFSWKFPHLDDLSSMSKSGRWLTPGLFDDYKVKGIAQLSDNEMILGMYGVASNEDKASLLVVTNFDRGVKKIVQLTKQGSILTVKLGGIAIAKDYIWISNSNKKEILSVKKSDFTSTISSQKPSQVDVSKIVSVEGTAGSVSYDKQSNFLWVADGNDGKAYGYKLSSNGDLLMAGLAPDRVIYIGTKGSRNDDCSNFMTLKEGDETGEGTLVRVVRTPSGLESVNSVDDVDQVIALAFSSGTFAEKENVELAGGDFEDRYFKIRLPILKTTFGINENCIYFRVSSYYFLRPRRLFPIGKMICGTKRKRSIFQKLLETDVYDKKLEEIHETNKRLRRNAADQASCGISFRENLLRGSVQFYRQSFFMMIGPVPVFFVVGAAGHYSVDLQAELCLENKIFSVGLIPGAWISVYAGGVRRYYFFARFRVPYIAKFWAFGCDIGFRWGSKNIIWEWGWNAPQLYKTLFTNCKENVDQTPPVAGICTARQVADTKYFVQWNSFMEDTKIIAYQVRIGSIKGSGDDYSSWVGTSLSQVVTNLPIMHGRDVFVSVLATNNGGIDSPLAYCPLFQARRKGPQIRYVYDGVVEEKDADYQFDTFSIGMNFAFKSDVNEIVNLKWGVSSKATCTLDESELNVVPLIPLGDSKSIQVSGLNLQHGQMYFNRLYALDKFGLKGVMCSDGIIIDTTHPIPTYFQDGAGEADAEFIISLRRVRGKFDPFIDPESPIVKYEWKIVANKSDEDISGFVNIPLTQQTPLMDGLSLKAGSSYRLVLRGTNAVGLQAVIETNGFIPDNTPPVCEGQVIDVTNETDTSDLDFVSELKSIQAKWKCYDLESDLRSQLVGVGTYPGGDDIRAFEELGFLSQKTVNGVSYVQFRNITILAKVRYHVVIKIINGAGLKKTVSSDGILIDTTPPTVAPLYIKDGEKGKDKNYTTDPFMFSAHWKQAFADAESGMAEYRVGLGTKPGLADIKAFSTVGSQTNVTMTGILLQSGQRYFVTVVGCNRVGMCVNASSDGAIVDFVPPHSGKVLTGLTGPPVLYQWITKSVWARWNWCLADEKRLFAVLNSSQCNNDSFYDVHSGIGMFGISVVSQSTDQLLAPFKSAGHQRNAGRNINLQDGVYSVAIEATDKAGIASRGLSNTFIVDSSPPLITIVQHGHFGENLVYINSAEVTFRSYFVIEDDLSKVKAYKIGVGSYSGADDIIKFKLFSLNVAKSSLRANWTSPKPTFIKNNQRYFITALAINNAGLFTIKSSPPLLSDFEAPENGLVLDGWDLQDAGFQSFSSLYRAHWYGFTDFSGIEKAYLGLSSKSNSTACDVKMEEIVSNNRNFHVLSGLALISGQKYYACLKLVDRAGNSKFFQSNGLVVDTSAPHPGYVNDGRPGHDIDVQMDNSVLRASWGNFTENETSIVSYQLAFGSFPGGQDVQGFTNVGMVNTATSSKLKVSELTIGHHYFATVVAYNVLGMPSSMVSSDGVVVDFTPPIFSKPVRDGNDSSSDFSYTSVQVLKATWKCEDPETGLSTIEIGFGLQPGDTNVMHFTRLPVSQTSFATNYKLQFGFRYFASVRCTNKVGLTTVSFSDGIVYDNTPPSHVYVQDGDYQSTKRTVIVGFRFVDPESGIQAYRVKVWETGSLNVHGFFNFSGNVTRSTLELSKDLVSGKIYYVNVTAVNGVGLEATKQSDGFAVDTTPPICSKIWDGKGDYGDDIEYAPSSNRFIISWVCHDTESPIVGYRFSVRDVQTNDFAIPFYIFKTNVTSSRSAIITGEGKMVTKFEEGHTYASGIEVVNAVGLKTINWTNGVTIDSTPPVVTNLKLSFYPPNDFLRAKWLVSDKESGLRSVAWGLGTTPEINDIKNFTEVSSRLNNISVSSMSFQQGIACFLNILAVNNGGLSSKSSSSAIIIDRSAPNHGSVAAYHAFPRNYNQSGKSVPNSSFVVAWTGFTDPESGIKKTSWAIGTDCQKLTRDGGDFYTEVVADDSVGGVIIENQTLVGNETYFVAVRVTNGVGLYRTSCSPGMLIAMGKLSAGVVSDGPATLANDIDFQLDDRAIWAHWRGFRDPVFGISRYDWCIRDKPPNLSGLESCAWPFMEVRHLKTRASRFHNLTLTHGKKYYVTVKAENKRGDIVMSSSDGVIIDRTPPVAKSIQISPSSGKDTLFLTSSSAPVVTWSMDDPESGISHFLVGVGSIPFQSDLLPFQRIDSLSRSLDLDQVNFTLYEGLMFYVTVTGVNMLGLETFLISQQVVVDWTPPEAGEIVDGNRTMPMTEVFIDSDYQRDKGMLFAHWSGIQDSESDVIEYQWCVGTAQGICDVKRMSSADLHTSVNHLSALHEGLRYFFTVTATNGAGLTEAIYSDGITVDTSPPVIKGVHHGVQSEQNDQSLLKIQNDGGYLEFYWDKPYDTESEISSVEWCAGTKNNSCNLISLTSVGQTDTSIKHYLPSLTPGTVVHVMLVVTNGAGMTRTVVAPPLLLDNTPPSAGNVTVTEKTGTTYVKEGDLMAVKWSGFEDSESRFSHFEWAICQASSKEKCISPFVNVGLNTTTNIEVLGMSYGVSYMVIVRAFNKVGLFSEATSNQFIVDGERPSAGTVYDGQERRKDIEFQTSTTQLSANWSPFIDVSGRIAYYEMCAGREPETCDVSGFVNLGIKFKGALRGLSLNHNGRYFVTVRATSESGYSTTATSNGVTIDSTPPSGGKVRDGQTLVDIDYQADGTYIYANWDEFQDEESGITEYTWCAGTRKGICDIISETKAGDRTSVGQEVLPPLPGGTSIFVTVSTLNKAGASNRVSSDGFKVDDSGPILSRVLDLQLGLGDEDIDYLTAEDSYCVSWDGGDSESGVLKSEVFVCSQLDVNDCLLHNLDVGNQTSVCVADLEFEEGITYVTKIRMENKVGLLTELYSDGFVVDSTPPFMGEITYVESSSSRVEKAEEHFTHSLISVQWNGFWDKESGIRTSYVCVGTQPGECNIKNFTEVRNSTAYNFQNLSLDQGETYFVSVKVENGAGLTSDVKASDGIVVDKTGPINEGAILDGTEEGKDIDIQQSRTLIAAHWNAFEDFESDVIKVTWCAGFSSGACDLVNKTQLDHNSTRAHRVLTKPIMNGQRYYVTVKATNGVGVTKSLTSDGVTADDTAPISGTVFDGLASDIDYVNGEDDISARWLDFVDLESGIESYEVAICDARNLSSCPQPFTAVGLVTNVTIAGLDLGRGGQYRFIVRATNYAGLKVKAFSDGFTVDFTPPTEGKVWAGAGTGHVSYQSDSSKMLVSWTPFTDFESGIVKYEVCASSALQNCTVTTFVEVGLNRSYTIDGLHLSHGKTYYAIVRGTNRIGLSSEMASNGVVIDLTLPTLKHDGYLSHTTRLSVTQPDLNVSLPKANNLTSSKENQTSSPITLVCSEEYLTSSWEEYEDQESGMVKYDWCVGTAEALCDVVSMRSVGIKTRGAAIVNRLRSGTKLFSTVYPVNGAKLRRRIISDPCTVISVAPKLSEVIDILSFNTSNFTDIDWKATTQSLSLRWTVIGSYLEEISRLRVQVAVTKLSSNRSVPRLLQEKSWNGEPFKQPFMDVLSWQRNVTIRSVTFHPWKRYRGIVRVWNEGGIYSEGCSDGLKMEPSPPPTRGLTIRDKAAENEHLRWWPNLRIPAVNKSAIDTVTTFVSSPAELELTVSSDTLNQTLNRTDFILGHNMFSPTAEFKIVVKRVTSGKNDSNTTSQSRTMKTIPGFTDSEGPCCANYSANTPSSLSDTHFKPILPTDDFGVSVAVLPNDVAAIGCKGKIVFQSLKNRSYYMALDDQSDPNARVKVTSHENRTGFLLNGKLHLYEHTESDADVIVLSKTIVIGKCKSVSALDCPRDKTWADNIGQAFAFSGHVIAVTGTNSITNKSIVAVFRENAGNWMFTQVIGRGKEVKDANFGHSISLNNRIMAIAAGEGKKCCIYIYSIPTLVHLTKICIAESASLVAPLSIYLTETDALVVLSKTSRLLKVFQFNTTSNSYHDVCEYRAWIGVDELSGNFDVNTREEGLIVAIGIEPLKGSEGVQLLGFQGIYSNDLQERKECVDLGTVLARESGLRIDGMGTRTSVSFKGDTILFGIPGVLTWPNNDQWLSTGRVFMATYCPSNHFRTRNSGLQSLRPTSCVPCEQGRKSFGAFAKTCSVCEGRVCFSPQINVSSSFSSNMCDNASCDSTLHLSNKTNGINVQLLNGSLFVAGSEHVYTVELLETTRAGESTSSLSGSFVIDSTAPLPGVVYDGLGSDQNTNCSENATSGEGHRCSTRDFQGTDVDFINNTREIHARWIDFLDNESDIVEYFWCVGWQPMTDDIRVCESTGMRQNGSHYGFNLTHGDNYYVTVIACNGARMCSAAHSDGVTIDTTPPVVTYVRDGVMGPDIDYQVFVDIIFAYFFASDPDSGVTSYEVAWGTGPNLVDVSDFEEVINNTIWRAKVKDGALEVGKKYYATVRATNGAGLLSDWLSSDGIVVGKSEYVFDNSSKASFFFDTVNVNDDGTREDGGVGKTYGTLTVPEGAVEEEVKLRCYSLDEKTLNKNKTVEGPVSNPGKTKPKQFMLGNYSFQIKALDPESDTVQEGFKFAKPIKLAMFYDVDNLVKANKEHVNNEVTKEDIDPVLYLWDPKNETWFDAALTCPEPWSHVNHSMKLLEVNVCHLTQFAFFFSFFAQNGLILFDKNHSTYSTNGHIEVLRRMTVTKLEILVRRSKGSQGDITVEWSLYGNDSSDSLDLIWPTSGKVSMTDGQWNDSFVLNVDNDRRQAPESVVWIQLGNPTGGALLASRDKTTTKILIASNLRADQSTWIITTISVCSALVIVLFVVSCGIKRYKKKSKRTITKMRRKETEMSHLKNANDSQNDQSTYNPVSPDNEMETTFSVFTPEAEMVAANPLYESAGLTYQGGTKENGNPLSESASLTGMGSAGAIVNPLYESTYNLTGVGGAPAVTNPLYEATPTEEEMGGEDNYGASDDEDGGDAKL